MSVHHSSVQEQGRTRACYARYRTVITGMVIYGRGWLTILLISNHGKAKNPTGARSPKRLPDGNTPPKMLFKLQHGLRRVSPVAVELKILAGFIGALVLLLIGGGFTYLATDEFAKSAQWVVHTQQVRVNLIRVHATISDAEA